MRKIIILSFCIWAAGSCGLNAQDYGNAQPDAETAQAPAVQPPANPASAQTPAPQTTAATGAPPSAQELANQVNNPAAPVTFIQFRDILIPSFPGFKGALNSLQMQPVLPIGPFQSFPFVQLVKITFPMVSSTPGVAPPVGCIGCGSGTTGVTGTGDLQVFDLVTIKQSWGRWGFGPALVFPTASANALGAGKYQIGPSAALIYTGVKNLTLGAIVQNPISYAGDPHRPSANNMIITPTLTLNLKEGWFVGLTDYNFSFNWENGGAPTIPLGMQVGKVVRIGKQPMSMSIEAGGAAARPAGVPNPGLILGFEVSPIFNFHLGPGQKIKARGKEQSN